MKLSEIRDDAALDAIADILEPFSELATDEEFTSLIKSGQKLKAAITGIKNHKKAIIDILAVLNGESPEDFHFSLISLPVMVMNVINEIESEEDLKLLFLSADVTETSSTSALENTEVVKE